MSETKEAMKRMLNYMSRLMSFKYEGQIIYKGEYICCDPNCNKKLIKKAHFPYCSWECQNEV